MNNLVQTADLFYNKVFEVIYYNTINTDNGNFLGLNHNIIFRTHLPLFDNKISLEEVLAFFCFIDLLPYFCPTLLCKGLFMQRHCIWVYTLPYGHPYIKGL